MASKKTKEQGGNLHLTIDTKYVDQTFNYDESIILSPSGSTQKLIQDGKIRECFVSLKKQNLNDIFKNPLHNSLTDIVADDDQAVPVLQHEQETSRYDHNANEYFEQENGKGKRRSPGRSKKKQTTKSTLDATDTRNLFASFSNGTPNLHHRSSNFEGKPSMDVDHKEIIEKAKAPVGANPSVCLRQEFSSAAVDTTFLVNLGDIADTTKPIEHTCGLKSKEEEQVSYKRRKKRRYPDVFRPDREDLALIKRVKNGRTVANKDFTGHDTSGVENYANSCSNKNVADRNSNSNPLVGSKHAPIKAHVRNTDEGFSNLEVSNSDQENSKLQHLNFCAKHKAAISKWKAQTGDKTDQLKNVDSHLGPSQLQASQEGSDHPVFQDNINSLPVDNISSTNEGRIKKQGVIDNENLNNQYTDTNSSQDTNECQSDSVSDQNRLIFSQTSSSTIVSQGIQDSITAQNDSQSLLNSPLDEREVVVAALIDMSNEMFSRQGVQCKEHESVNESSTNSTPCSPEELAVTDSNHSTLIETVRTPQSYVAVNKQYTMQALTQAVESVIEQERNSLQDVGRSKSELACFQMDSDEGSKSELTCMQIDTINPKENEISLNQSDDASTSAEYLSNSTVINGPQGESVSVLYSSKQEKISEKVLQEQRVEKRSFQVTSSDSLIDPVEKLQTQSRLMIPVDPSERNVDKEESVRDTQTPVDINQGLQVLSSCVTTDQSQTLVESTHETLQSGSRILGNQPENFAMITQNAVEDEERHHKVSTDEPMLHSLDAVKRSATELQTNSLMYKEMGSSLTTICKSKGKALIEDQQRPEIVNSKTTIQQSPNQVDKLIAEVQFQSGVSADQKNTMEENCKEVSSKENQAVEGAKIDAVILTSSEVDEKTLESESVIQSDRTNPLEQEHNSLEEDYTLQSSDSGVTMQPTLNGIEESTADQQSQISEDRLDLSKKSSADFQQEDTHVSHVTIGKSLNVDATYEEKLQTRISNDKEVSSKQTPGEIAQTDTEVKTGLQILPSDEVLKCSLDSTQSSFVELQTEPRISGHEVNNSNTYTNMSYDVLYWAANPHEPKTDNRDNITREITEIAETSTVVKPTPNDAENQWAEIHCNATAKARLDEIINVLGQKISHQTPSSSDSDDTPVSKQLDQCDVERKLQRDSNDNIEGNENESLPPGQNDQLKDNVAAEFGQCQNRMDSDVTADKANSNQALRENVKLLGTCCDENHVHISQSEEATNECKEQIPNENDEIQIDRDIEHSESSPNKNAELSDHKHKSDSPNIQSESGNESDVVKGKDTDVPIPPTLHEKPVNGSDANTSTQRRSRKQTTPQHTPYIQLRNPWKDVSHNSGTEEIRELLLNNRQLQPVQGIANGNQQCPRFQGPYSQRSNQQAYLPTDIKTNMEKPGGKARVQIVTMPDGNRVVVRFDEHGSPIIPLNTRVPSGMIDLQSTVYHRDLHTSSLHQPIGEVSAVPAAEHHQVAAADINKSAEQNDTSTLGQVLPTGLPQQVQHVMQSVPPPPKKEGAVSQVLELSRMYLKTLETAAGREAVISDIERLEKISKGVNRQPVAITELAIAANGDALNRHLQKINGHTTDNNQGGGENSDLINRIAAAEIQRLQQMQNLELQRLQQMQNLELQEERLRQKQIARLHQQKLVNETNQGRKGQGFKHHLRAQHETPQEQELRLQQLRQQHQLYLQHQQQSTQQQSQQLPQKNPEVGRYIQQKLKEKQARNHLRNLQQAQQYSIQQQAMDFQQQTSHHTEMKRQQIPVEQLANQYPFQIQPQTSTERTHQRTHELYIQRQLQIQQQRQAMQQKQKSKLMTPKSVKEQLLLQRTQQIYGGLDQVLPHKQIEHTTNDPTLPRIVEVKSMSQESKPPDQFIDLLKLNQQLLQNEPVADSQLMPMQAGVPTTLDNSYASRQIEQIVQKHMVKTSEAVLIPEHLFNVSDTHGNFNTVQTLSSNTTFNDRNGPPVLPKTTPTIPFQTQVQNTAQQYLVKTGPGTGPRGHPIAAFEQSSRVGMINQSIPKSALPVYRHPPPPYPHPHNTANMKATVQQNHNLKKESIINNGSDKEQMSDLTLLSSDYFKQISSQVNSILTPHGLVPVISLDRLKTHISSNPKQHILQKGDIIANSAPSYCPTKQSNGGTQSSPVMPPVPSEDDKTKAHLPKTSCENGNNENLSMNAIAKCTNKETDQEGQKAVSEKGDGEADTTHKEKPKEISQPSLPIDKADKDFFYLMLDQLGIQDLSTNIPVMPRSAIQQSGPMLIPIYAENVPSKIANSHRVTDEARSNSPGSTAKEEHQTSSDGISFSDFIQMISKISVNGHNNTDNLKVTESGSTPIATSTTAADATSLIPEDNDLSENCSDKDTPRREWSVVSSTSGKENPDEAPLKLKLKISKISDSSNKRKRGRPKGSTNKRKRSEDGDVESDDPEPPQYHLCQFCDYTHRFHSVVRQHVKLVHFAKFSTAPLKFPKTKKAKPLQITNERRRNTFSGIPSNPITDISIQRQLSDGSSNCSSADKLQTVANPPISTKLPNENSCQNDSKENMNAEINCDQRIGKDYVPQLQSGQLETNLSNEGVTEEDHDAKAPEHVNQIKDDHKDPTLSSKAPEREIVTDTQPTQMESQNNKGSCHDENGLSEIQEGPEEPASSSEDSCKEKEICSEANDSNSGGSQLLTNDVLDLEEDHECNQCKQRFPTPEKLFTHCKLVHSNTKGLHLCYTCGYTTRVASILQRHIMKWHSRGTKHTCTSKSCGKTFGTAEELKQHMREHFGKRKYECRLCGSSYHYINGLRAHQVRHTYDYPFKCGQCGLKFKTKGMLERHEFQRKHFSG